MKWKVKYRQVQSCKVNIDSNVGQTVSQVLHSEFKIQRKKFRLCSREKIMNLQMIEHNLEKEIDRARRKQKWKILVNLLVWSEKSTKSCKFYIVYTRFLKLYSL